MGLKLRLEWYDKKTELGEGKEYSRDLGNDDSVFIALGIPVENNVNNGGFNVDENWRAVIQPYFQHTIVLANYDYQMSFDYRDVW
ncbi:colicin E3-like toxin immunity protein [Pseudomonas sp. MYb118]|uniref:colicin E3-like toxin immunity protein n=1 Tax=Pseudomonas sp. MYb118 TaxID=1848720 RepID=UPI0034CDB0B6